MAKYKPGVCNLDKAETAHRRKAGDFMLALTVTATILLFVFSAQSLAVFIVVLFLSYLTAICYLQAKNRFCVQYAAAGKQNTSETSKKGAKPVAEDEAKETDRAKANNMHAQAMFIGLVVASVVAILSL